MRKNIFLATSLIIVLVISVIIFIKMSTGQTTTSIKETKEIKGDSLVCESKNAYPIFSYDLSNDKKIKIVIGFYDNKIRAISLTYELYYDDTQQIIASEANNHATMNIDFSKNRLGADAYNANYSKLKDRMRMTLYTTVDKFDNKMARYFLINLNDIASTSYTINEYRNNYEAQNFICTINSN